MCRQFGFPWQLQLGLLLALASNGALADQFYVLAETKCNKTRPEVTVKLHGLWNEAGEKASNQHGVVDPRKLVKFEQDAAGRYSVKKKALSTVCTLGSQSYVVTTTPVMAPGFHPEGKCATRIGATVTIATAGRTVASESIDACTETGAVTTSIVISPGQPVSYKRIAAAEFYRQPSN